jgi:hypothetical protein
MLGNIRGGEGDCESRNVVRKLKNSSMLHLVTLLCEEMCG